MKRSASLSSESPTGLFGAFADPTRLRILNLLGVRELCVGDLCDVLGEIQPKVSRHLAILREVGLVKGRRLGKWRLYSLASERSPLQSRLLGCVGECLGQIEPLADDRRRLDDVRGDLRCA